MDGLVLCKQNFCRRNQCRLLHELSGPPQSGDPRFTGDQSDIEARRRFEHGHSQLDRGRNTLCAGGLLGV